MVQIIEPHNGTVFDPACGSGGMFVQSAQFIEGRKTPGEDNSLFVYGSEKTLETVKLAKMNIAVNGLRGDIRQANSYYEDVHDSFGKFDYVLANPPFNVSNWHPEDLPEGDPRLFGPKEEFTTDGSANYMWMQTFWSHLSDTGTAGIVMANGAMTSNSKGERNVRQHMVDNSMVDAIVRLPDKLFLTTGIPACLFILSKNRDGKDGTHRQRNNEILFVDASKMGTMASRKLRVFTNEDISRIADTYHAWRTNGDNYNDIDGFSKAATLAEVQKQDYKLTPGIYVGTEAEEDDGILFEDKMETLKAQLLAQFEKGEVLKSQIIANFDKL